MKYSANSDCSISPSSLKAKTTPPHEFSAAGHCRRCGKYHGLGAGNCRIACLQLMELFTKQNNISLSTQWNPNEANLSLTPLFGEERGKMFGVMECIDPHGAQLFLHALSGQFNGHWLVNGWAQPVFSPQSFAELNQDEEKKIKELGRRMIHVPERSAQWYALRNERRTRSRNLMSKIHDLYHLTNFRGETRSLREVFQSERGQNPPTGTGDCCAPKLLNQAAIRGVTPIGISEFFWGKDNRSGTRRHGQFYPSCREKCTPIMGFLLCGLEKD